MNDILEVAREQVLERGEGLDEGQVLEVLRLADERLDDALALAHEVRMRWCGPAVEVEGIVSVKTGGCPEDCHFCSQSGRFETPVRAARLDIPSLVEAARQTAATGATEFCIVAAVRGPDERLMAQVRDSVAAIQAAVDINVACSLGILTAAQATELAELGVHRYNHNLETARSLLPAGRDHAHVGGALGDAGAGPRPRHGGLLRLHHRHGRDARAARRARRAARRARPRRGAAELPRPRPGHAVRASSRPDAGEALRTIAAFRLAMPRTVLRFAGGRELTLGDLGARQGMLGGINAIIVGNYLTTLGRDPHEDLDLLAELSMPVKALSETL